MECGLKAKFRAPGQLLVSFNNLHFTLNFVGASGISFRSFSFLFLVEFIVAFISKSYALSFA